MTDHRRTMLQGCADVHGFPLEAAVDQFAAKVGIARCRQSEDVAGAVAFLFTLDKRWVTETVLRVDGGETRVS